MGAGINLFKTLFPSDYYPFTANSLMSAKPTGKVIKDENDQTIETIIYSGNELRGLLKVGTNGLYADGDIDDGSGTGAVRYGIVDLGELTLTKGSRNNDNTAYVFYGLLEDILPTANPHTRNAICELGLDYQNTWEDMASNTFMIGSYLVLCVDYSDEATRKTAMSGKYLVYELATPTTQTLTAWSNPIKAAAGGTEEFTDSRTIKMPTGHDTIYSKKTSYRYWR